MSGKQKQAHRTKGNVRPSSSARAAELLANSGSSAPGFIGFGALSDLGYVPASGASDEADNSVDPDFRMVLRKLSKKDSTTKIKALQELSTLCQERDLDTVKTVLPFWPRIFTKLSTDNDRRVREACYQSFEQMVLKVRKHVAPHLKVLMGPWIVGQCDVYPPASSAAKASFQAAFPPAKQTEAVVFCKEEVIGHIKENLLVLTPTTLSDPKTTEKEDMESRYQKLVASTLQGWKLFTTLLPSEHQVKLQQHYSEILNNTKFWKLAKHEVPMIKGSFYSLIGALCQSNLALANQFADKICPVVLHNLDESDPIVCPSLWESVLYTISTVEDCWGKVNARKGVLPKLWSVLKQGGNGCAYLIHSNLLPFLSKIPAELVGDGIGFYNEWFTNMITGLSLEKVQSSKIEVSAITNCVVECMRYVLTRHGSDSEMDHKVVNFVLQEKLLILLEASFVDESKHLSASPLYSWTADLLLFLYKNDSQSLKESSLVFWKALSDSVSTHIENVEEDNKYTLERIGAFLEAFVKPTVPSEKKKTKIKFADKDNENEVSSNEPYPSHALLDVDSPLQMVVKRSSSTCLTLAQKDGKPSLKHMKLLSSICKSFPSRALLCHLYSSQLSDNVVDDGTIHIVILKDMLLPWIVKIKDYNVTVQSAFTESMGEILFMVYRLGSSEEKCNLLGTLCENGNIQALVIMCRKVIEHEVDPSVLQWLRGPKFGEILVANTKELCTLCLSVEIKEDSLLEQRWNLLKFAVTTQVNGDPIVGKAYIGNILGTILNALPQQEKRSSMSKMELDRCVTFVSDVATLLYGEMKESLMEQSAEDLLLSLYQVSCQQLSPVSDTVLAKVQQAWKLGVTSLIQLKGGLMSEKGFFFKAAEHMKYLVKRDTETCNRVEKLSELGLELAHHIGLVLHEENTAILSHPTVSYFMNLLGINEKEDYTSQWMLYRTGQLTFEHSPSCEKVSQDTSIPKGVPSIVFTSNLLVASVYDGAVLNETDFDTVGEVARAIGLCDSLIGKQKQLWSQTELVKVQRKLEKNLQKLVEKISTSDQDRFVESVIEKSLNEGGLGSICLQVVLSETKRSNWNLNIGSLMNITDRFNVLVEPVLHTLQVVVPYLSKSELGPIVELLTAQLLSCDQQTITSITGGRGFLAGVCCAAIQQEQPVGDDVTGGGIHIEPQVVLSVLTEVQLWREQHEDLFLFESDLSSAKWELVSLNTEVMKLLKLLVEKIPTVMSEHQWDFVLCSLVSWVQTCRESKNNLDKDPIYETFLLHTCELLSAVAGCMKHVMPQRADAFPPNLATEWNEFFSEGAYTSMLPIYIQLTESFATRRILAPDHDSMLRSLCAALSLCPSEHLKSHQLPAKLVADHETSAPDEIQTILNHLCPRLISSNRATQLTAYRLVQSLLPHLPAYDIEKEKDGDAEREMRSPPPALMTVLDTCSSAVDLIMSGTLVGEAVTVEADTDEDVYTRGYLLCWDLLLIFFKSAASERGGEMMRAQYAAYLRNQDAVDHLLANLFRLMPDNPVIQVKDTPTALSSGQKISSVMSMFSNGPELGVSGDNSNLELQHLACTVYHQTLQDLPALVRQWWNAQDKRVAGIVDRFTSKHVTNVLCSEEMEAIHKSEVAMEDLTIKTRPAAREVAATYTIQEFTMELVVTLPVNHPLGVVSVESGKRVGVPTNLWRNWMLQMTTYLTHQNGTILDGLALWKKNVDKKFSGVEECMVCFAVIHPSNYQLPRLQCKVCKKKFHSACLYKWFSTSNNSTCPMCRSLF